MRFCDYGCGQQAKYQFKNGKWCCNKNYVKCPVIKEKISKGVSGNKNGMFGKKHTDESRTLIRNKHKGKMTSNKTKEKQRIANLKENSYLWKGGYYSKGLPMYDTYNCKLNWIEKCKRNNSDSKILEVKCAYCGNWFIPSLIQVGERIRCINNEIENSGSESRFYCSEQCKRECPIYGQHYYPKDYKPATSREVQPELRQMRFKIDNYTCQRCGKHQDELKTGLHCHHIEGIRWEPLESADLDKVITLCKDCHKEVHKIEGCGYNDMKCKEE